MDEAGKVVGFATDGPKIFVAVTTAGAEGDPSTAIVELTR